MLFTSINFLYYFLPIVLILYFAVPKKAKNLILFIASIAFYFYGEPKYIFLMLIEIVIAYLGAIAIEKYKKKSILAIVIAIHIGILIFFKYTDFIITNINNVFNIKLKLLRLALPIGISFYTFQIVSYEIDVFKGNVKAQKNLLTLATYVSLFPQLISGPIVRYETIEQELVSRKHSFENCAYGIRRFTIGLAKKVLVANILGDICDKFTCADEKTVVLYWMFAIAYMLQIYFDFSAYSDMAIGLGRIFGFHFLENFKYPYISKSITEFWRRWHISLGTWFKDYVYIPLGGSREGKLKLIRNLLIVWGLTGLWHGASWNFIVWGVMFGIILIIEKLLIGKYIEKLPKIIRSIYVLFIVMIGFIIFNANTMEEAFNNIAGLFGANSISFINDYTIYYLKSYLITILIAIIGATPLIKNIIMKLKEKTIFSKIINVIEPIAIVGMLFVVTAYLVNSSSNSFLYFRF